MKMEIEQKERERATERREGRGRPDIEADLRHALKG